MDAELESVTKNGNIDALDPALQTKIRTEIVRNSLDISLLPKAEKDQISHDNLHIKWETLTTLQKQQILDSEYIHNFSQRIVKEYQNLQETAKKSGKSIDPETLKKFQADFGLKSLDTLTLSEIRPNTTLP